MVIESYGMRFHQWKAQPCRETTDSGKVTIALAQVNIPLNLAQENSIPRDKGVFQVYVEIFTVQLQSINILFVPT